MTMEGLSQSGEEGLAPSSPSCARRQLGFWQSLVDREAHIIEVHGYRVGLRLNEELVYARPLKGHLGAGHRG
jgi:hypothetical protein